MAAPECAFGDILLAPAERRPHVCLPGFEIEPGRHHTDDSCTDSIESNILSHDRRIRAEISLPQVVTQHDNVIISFPRFFRSEGPTDFGRHSKNVKKVSRDIKPPQTVWCVAGKKKVIKVRNAIGPSEICGHHLE